MQNHEKHFEYCYSLYCNENIFTIKTYGKVHYVYSNYKNLTDCKDQYGKP